MNEATHQTGFIITKLDDGSYAYSMTSVGISLTPQHLRDFFDFLEMHSPLNKLMKKLPMMAMPLWVLRLV